MEKRALERRARERAGRIVVGSLAGIHGGWAGQASIEAADRQALVAQKLARKTRNIEAQIALIDVSRLKAGEAGELVNDRLPLVGRQRVSLVQGLEIIARGKFLRLLERGLQIVLKIGRQLVVIPRVGGVARQMQRIREAIGEVGAKRAEIEDGGDEHDPVEGDALINEITREAGGAEGAVTFAGD